MRSYAIALLVGAALLALVVWAALTSTPGDDSSPGGSDLGRVINPSAGARALAVAAAFAEGFGKDGTIPTRAHNPGDLKLGDLGHGTLGEGITIFRDDQEGWEYAYGQWTRIEIGSSLYYKREMTLAQVGAIYTGPVAGAVWAANVAYKLRAYGYPWVTTQTTLAEIYRGGAVV